LAKLFTGAFDYVGYGLFDMAIASDECVMKQATLEHEHGTKLWQVFLR